jgi:hypothetical protein
MEFYIDLEKAINLSRLVKKPVQVRGTNGKVFTRMQWVDPTKGAVNFGHLDNSDHKDYAKRSVEHVRKNWDEIQKHVHGQIQQSSPTARHRQSHSLDKTLTHKDFSILGTHPGVLHNFLERGMGRERLEQAREKLKNSSLTINTEEDTLDSIHEKGYVPSRNTDMLSDAGKKKYEGLIKDPSLSNELKLDKLREWSEDDTDEDAFAFNDLLAKQDLYHHNLGMDMSDTPPIFMSFNPSGSEDGAATHFGDGVVHVDPSILGDSTANIDDNLMDVSPVSKIHDMEHLKDLFILKHYLSNGTKVFDRNDEDLEEWDNHWYDTEGYGDPHLPMEIQYHGSKLPTSLIKGWKGTQTGLYIDLRKGVLNFAKLVKKAVQVRGKNGKVFTRMQWVSPGEISTGEGVRKINTQEGLKRAMHDGMDKHPHFHEAMKEQGVHPDTFEDHHPHFFLPETRDSKKSRDARQEKLEEEHGFHKVVEDDEHGLTFEWGVPDHQHKLYDEHEFVPKGMSDSEFDNFLKENGIHPEIHSVIKTLEGRVTEDMADDPATVVEYMGIGAGSSMHIIRKHVEDHIRATTKDEAVQKIQLKALEKGHHFHPAMHPAIAKAIVDKAVGKHLADKFRKDLDVASLSVNFAGKHLDNIAEGGYIASTLEQYVENTFGDPALDDFHLDITHGDFSNEQSRIEAISDLPGGHGWDDVYNRAWAEYKAIGLHIEDPKPTYIAFNHNGNKTGGASWFGNRWLKVNDKHLDDVIQHSTASLDDTFNDTRSIPKIFSMEHLKDMMIMKCIDNHPDMKYIVKHGEGDYPEWHLYKGDIPLEIQYHQPKLEPHQFDIMPDASRVELNMDNIAKVVKGQLGLDTNGIKPYTSPHGEKGWSFGEGKNASIVFRKVDSGYNHYLEVVTRNKEGNYHTVTLSNQKIEDHFSLGNQGIESIMAQLEKDIAGNNDLETGDYDFSHLEDAPATDEHIEDDDDFSIEDFDDLENFDEDAYNEMMAQDSPMEDMDDLETEPNQSWEDLFSDVPGYDEDDDKLTVHHLEKGDRVDSRVLKGLDEDEWSDTDYRSIVAMRGKLHEPPEDEWASHSDIASSAAHDYLQEDYEKSPDKDKKSFEQFYNDNIQSFSPIFGAEHFDVKGNRFHTVLGGQNDEHVEHMADLLHKEHGTPVLRQDDKDNFKYTRIR